MASEVLMPLGISFYTFASITYLYSIYQAREEKQNTNLQSFEFLATYLSFFPTFVAGPIMRAEFFFSQLHEVARIADAVGDLDKQYITIPVFGNILSGDKIIPL